jgi:hypothetical protein
MGHDQRRFCIFRAANFSASQTAAMYGYDNGFRGQVYELVNDRAGRVTIALKINRYSKYLTE